jgi:hypothetical protein
MVVDSTLSRPHPSYAAAMRWRALTPRRKEPVLEVWAPLARASRRAATQELS